MFKAGYFNDPYNSRDLNPTEPMIMDAGAEGSSGAEWLHGHLRRYGDVYGINSEELAIRLI